MAYHIGEYTSLSPFLMLTPDELRIILKQPTLSDDQAEQLLDTLQVFARVFIEGYLREKAQKRQHGQGHRGIEPETGK